MPTTSSFSSYKANSQNATLVKVYYFCSGLCYKNKTHQFDICQGQVGINTAKLIIFYLIATIL